jgi:CBS-domain-containing membrane protein
VKIKDYMKRDVIFIPVTATIGDAATLYAQHHIGTLPVIDRDRQVGGLLHRRALLHRGAAQRRRRPFEVGLLSRR